MMRIRIISSDWLWYGVVLSVLPLALVLGLYIISTGHRIEEIDYVPDLILVSFAVAVNLLSSTNSNRLRDDSFEKFCIRFSIISMLFCFAGYYFLVGVVINLNEELLKLQMLVEENPESLSEIASEIKDFLNQRIETTPWIVFIGMACSFIVVSAILGHKVEKKAKDINAEDYEQIVSEIRQFLKVKKATMSAEDYKKIVADTRRFLMREELIATTTRLVDDNADGLYPDDYNNIIEKVNQVAARKGGEDENS